MTTPSPEPDASAAPSSGRVPGPAGDAGPVPAGPPSYGAFAAGPPGYPVAPGHGVGAATAGAPGGPGTEANNLAVWSLVLAVLSWVCFGLLTSIPAIVVGARAKKAAAQGRANNPGMANAGVVLGWISTVLNLLVLVACVVLIATRGWDGLVDLFEQYSDTTP